MTRIRPFQPGDEPALADICLKTADDGADATGVLEDDSVWAEIFVLPYVTDSSSLFVFAVLYGFDWFATGPSTVALIAKHFGQDRVGVLFGLVFVSHQIGSAIAALGAGWIYSEFGEYYYAFLTGAVMGLLAAGMAMMIRRDRDSAPAVAIGAEAARA